MQLGLTTLVFGGALAGAVVWWTQRGVMAPMQALFWLLLAAASVVLGAFPALLDALAHHLGVAYSPALLLLLSVMVLFVKALACDTKLNQLELRVRVLNQELAILRARTITDEA